MMTEAGKGEEENRSGGDAYSEGGSVNAQRKRKNNPNGDMR